MSHADWPRSVPMPCADRPPAPVPRADQLRGVPKPRADRPHDVPVPIALRTFAVPLMA